MGRGSKKLTVMESEMPLELLVRVGQKRSEEEVSMVMAYISRRSVHTPRHDSALYL